MRFIVLFYGLLILIGGIIGHMKTASTASLVSGVIFGLLLMGAAIAMFQKKNWGSYTALFLTFILDGFFSYRYLVTGHFLPAGLLSLISLSVLIALALSLQKRRSS